MPPVDRRALRTRLQQARAVHIAAAHAGARTHPRSHADGAADRHAKQNISRQRVRRWQPVVASLNAGGSSSARLAAAAEYSKPSAEPAQATSLEQAPPSQAEPGTPGEDEQGAQKQEDGVLLQIRSLDGALLCALKASEAETVASIVDRVEALIRDSRHPASPETQQTTALDALGTSSRQGDSTSTRRLVHGCRVLCEEETLSEVGIVSNVDLQLIRSAASPALEQRLAVADRTVRIWDLESGNCVRRLDGHTDVVRCVVVLPGETDDESDCVASASMDKTVRIWRVSAGDCVQILIGHQESVQALAVVPNGRLASASLDRTVRVWSCASGENLQVFEGHAASVLGIAYVPGLNVLVSGSSDRTLRVLCLENGECTRVLEGHSGIVRGVAAIGDGLLASASTDHTVRLWRVATGECETAFQGHTASVMAVTALAFGVVASASADQTIRVWVVPSGECVRVLEGHTASVLGLCGLPGGLLASASLDRTVRIWRVDSAFCIQVLGGHSSDVVSVVSLPQLAG